MRRYEQLVHGARTGISWSGAAYTTGVSVATFGHWLTEGLQFQNESRNSSCLNRISLLLPRSDFHAVRQHKNVRREFLQLPSVTPGIEAKLSAVTCETGGGGVLRNNFW